MKELLLHIGFPKCASTTLQESVLFNLRDQINFLGRSRQLDKSENYIIGNDIISGNGLSDFDSSRLKDGINVISDEILLMPKSLWPTWGNRKHPDNAKSIFKNFDAEIDSFKIIVILRNQTDWIYSNFSFNYAALMKSNTKFKNFDLLINELENKKSVFNDFDFTKSIKSYKDQFGLDSMSFLFVEELNDINSESIAKLSNLLNVDKKLIFNLINDKKNVQIKKDQTTKSTLKSEGLIKIWHFYNNNLRFLRPIIKNFNFLKDSYKLESLTDHQKEKIFNLYQDHNKDFAKEYDLRESMKRLNYY